MAQQDITEGPSKYDLQAALFDGKKVCFTVEGLGQIEVQMNNVGIEDGGRESWLIEGYAFLASQQKFHGYYETRRRKGWLELKPLITVVDDPLRVREDGIFSELKKALQQFNR
jgi:hypothetical protein